MSTQNTPRPSLATPPIVASIAPYLDGVEGWICDIWGVVHNGLAHFPSAVDACRRFRAAGGTIVLLTNAPRPAAAVVEQLDKLEVPRDAWDSVLTSGDLTLALIDDHKERSIVHVGPPRDAGLFAGKTLVFKDITQAELIVCSGLHDDDRETAEDYRARLVGPAARGVPMICANPDVTVARGDKVIPCAGAIAQVYESLGGQVLYAGKPYLPIYERAYQMMAEVRGRPIETSRVLAIGDGINTDIKGAIAAGLRSVLVQSPVHLPGPLTPETLDHALAPLAGRPVVAMGALAW